jgi:MFS family permease
MTLDLRTRLRHVAHAPSAALFLALGINAFGAGMFFPFALLYYQSVTSLSVAGIGLVLTCATLGSLAVNPVTGVLVDRLGARRLVVAGLCLEAAGFLAYLAVSSTVTLLAAALLATAGTRMFFASSSTLIAESISGAGRDRWYGMVGITQTVGASLSGVLASLLIGAAGGRGFRAAIVTNVGCLLVAAMLIHRGRGPHPARRTGAGGPGYRAILRDGSFLAIVGSNLLVVLCSMMTGLGIAVYATGVLGAPLWALGVIGAVQTTLVVGMQTRVTRSMQGVRRTRTMVIAGAIWIVACLGYAAGVLAPPGMIVPYLLLTGIVMTLAQLLYAPASRALVAEISPSGAQGRAIATYELSWGVAAAASPALFGAMYGLAPNAPWLAMACLLAVASCVLLVAERGIPEWWNRPLLDVADGFPEALDHSMTERAGDSGRMPVAENR